MTSAKPDPIPAGYRRVTPCLVVQGGDKALEFYAEVFGATERMRFPGPDGSVAHAEIEIGDSVVIVEDESPTGARRRRRPVVLPGTPVFQFIYVDDVDAVGGHGGRARRDAAAGRRRTSSTATGTATSSTRSGTAGRSRRTSRTLRPDEMMRRMAECSQGVTRRPDEVRADVRRHRAVRRRPGRDGRGRAGAGLRPGARVVRRRTPTRSAAATSCRPPETATTVRLDGGEPLVTDGPFVEGKEVVSGYTEIDVADLDEALRHGEDLAGLPDRGDPARAGPA